MPSKVELQKKLEEMNEYIIELRKENHLSNTYTNKLEKDNQDLKYENRNMKAKLDLLSEINMKDTIFITADVSMYPQAEQEGVLNHIRERMDNEIERLKLHVNTVVLPGTVKSIDMFKTKVNGNEGD